MRRDMEAPGGKSITLPDLAERVADDIYSRRISIKTAATELAIGNHADLGRRRSEVRKVLRSPRVSVEDTCEIVGRPLSDEEQQAAMREDRLRAGNPTAGLRTVCAAYPLAQ
jgi:hypothetical protein